MNLLYAILAAALGFSGIVLVWAIIADRRAEAAERLGEALYLDAGVRPVRPVDMDSTLLADRELEVPPDAATRLP
jgi:hypothetical protein